MAYIVPVYKSGSRGQVSNYRDISILCCPSKILEKLIYKTLCNTLSSIFSENQHGTMKNRSTATNLMSYVSTLFREVEARQQVDSIYIDFAKAFDTVSHIVVTEKFKPFGLSSMAHRVAYITSEVPQGSVLVSFTFNVFINDLHSLISSYNLSFADDLRTESPFRRTSTSCSSGVTTTVCV